MSFALSFSFQCVRLPLHPFRTKCFWGYFEICRAEKCYNLITLGGCTENINCGGYTSGLSQQNVIPPSTSMHPENHMFMNGDLPTCSTYTVSSSGQQPLKHVSLSAFLLCTLLSFLSPHRSLCFCRISGNSSEELTHFISKKNRLKGKPGSLFWMLHIHNYVLQIA